MLRWWHKAISLFPIRWSNSRCTDVRAPGRHLGVDERTSPTAQPGKDWASCLPCHSNSTAWLTIQLGSSTITPSTIKKSWCNLWWPADLQRAHCNDCSILQVCTTQHQKYQALSQGSRFLYLSHGYNQKWNVNQIRSAQWTVQKNKNKNNIKVTQHKSIIYGKKEK